MTERALTYAPPTSLRVSRFRFLHQLHTLEQQVLLDAFQAEAMALTFAQMTNTDPAATNASGMPLAALKPIRIAYRQMLNLDELDLLSADMDVFFTAVSALGLYGQDSQAEIARIKSNTPPA